MIISARAGVVTLLTITLCGMTTTAVLYSICLNGYGVTSMVIKVEYLISFTSVNWHNDIRFGGSNLTIYAGTIKVSENS